MRSTWTASTTCSSRIGSPTRSPVPTWWCSRLALTPETDGLFGRDEFEMMEDDAWIVNVARGRHIITDHLVEALQNNTIGGAALDVTDPEPLPDGHALWSLPNCIITPHVGNTPGDGQAAPGEAGDGERPSVSQGQGTPRTRRRRSGLLSTRGVRAP